ncbi:hypothetical protein SAMN05444161_4714 [Rhizobiales bacterium GAS191]|nr:hypothetical protein SAMN05444161_4714 [Rhizobiales bacterium GAS191]
MIVCPLGLRCELEAELPIANDLAAAQGAFDAAAFVTPGRRVTLGQQAQILRASGPEALTPSEERSFYRRRTPS